MFNVHGLDLCYIYNFNEEYYEYNVRWGVTTGYNCLLSLNTRRQQKVWRGIVQTFCRWRTFRPPWPQRYFFSVSYWNISIWGNKRKELPEEIVQAEFLASFVSFPTNSRTFFMCVNSSPSVLQSLSSTLNFVQFSKSSISLGLKEPGLLHYFQALKMRI